MDSRNFQEEVALKGGRGFVVLPFEPDDAWGAKERHHVSGLVNGVKVRGPLGDLSGAPAIVLGPAWLRDNPLSDGQSVEVEVWAEGPQVEALPEDIAAALDASPPAKAFFESLATFYRKAYLTWLAGSARRPDVRKERIAEFIGLLEAGKKERPK